MVKPKLTRAQRRERRAAVPASGVYGIDAEDAEANSWTGRYVFFAQSADEAKTRIREAGFHRKQIAYRWGPGHEPPEGPGWYEERPEALPPSLGQGDGHWYRSRLDDGGWTPWERLPRDYGHPPQRS